MKEKTIKPGTLTAICIVCIIVGVICLVKAWQCSKEAEALQARFSAHYNTYGYADKSYAYRAADVEQEGTVCMVIGAAAGLFGICGLIYAISRKAKGEDVVVSSRELTAEEQLQLRKQTEQENLQKLKGYKELLDSGAITPKEFEREKEKLMTGLGLKSGTAPVPHNTGSTWQCPECGEVNPNAKRICKSCGHEK